MVNVKSSPLPFVTFADILAIYVIYSPKIGSKIKKKTQTQVNLTNMQSFPNYSAQPGLKVIKKININSITQLTCSFTIS